MEQSFSSEKTQHGCKDAKRKLSTLLRRSTLLVWGGVQAILLFADDLAKVNLKYQYSYYLQQKSKFSNMIMKYM